MFPVSVCLIAKNEADYLETCLSRLSRYDWEIVVTDTGSADDTPSIAAKYAHQVHSFPWCGDFSAARNFCVSKASHDWILSIDCDEYLCNKERPEELLRLLKPCLEKPEAVGLVYIQNPFVTDSGTSISTEPIGRFFNRKYYSYQGKIHEQPIPLSGTAASYQPTPFLLYHEGYGDPTVLQNKAMRNISLLEASLQEDPNDPYLYYQLGQSYFVMGKYDQAYPIFQKALTFDLNPSLLFVKTMVESYGYCMLHLKKYEEALTFEGIYETFQSRADFLFLMGLIYMNNGLFEEAIKQFLLATKTEDFCVEGVNSYLAFYNAGVIRECMGNPQEAHSFYQKCGSYGPALEGLKRVKG